MDGLFLYSASAVSLGVITVIGNKKSQIIIIIINIYINIYIK